MLWGSAGKEASGAAKRHVIAGSERHAAAMKDGYEDTCRAVRFDRRDPTKIVQLSHDERVSRLNTHARLKVTKEMPDGSREDHTPHTWIYPTKAAAAKVLMDLAEFKEFCSLYRIEPSLFWVRCN
ncbi:MAG: hypothetical protein AAF368_20920, partial [Planctomycetota bacterium]